MRSKPLILVALLPARPATPAADETETAEDTYELETQAQPPQRSTSPPQPRSTVLASDMNPGPALPPPQPRT